MGGYDYIPDWIKTVTFHDEFMLMDPKDVLDKYNYLKGAYWGFELKIKELEKELAEANEKFDLSRDYQRQLDIQALENMRDAIPAGDAHSYAQRHILDLAIKYLEKGK